MKPLSETYKELGIGFIFPIEIWGVWGNQTYFENSDGYWERYERDDNGYATYFEDSNDYYFRYERDDNGNETYYEDSTGVKRGTPKSTNQ